MWLELARQFHTIIGYLYIVMYKEVQYFGGVKASKFGRKKAGNLKVNRIASRQAGKQRFGCENSEPQGKFILLCSAGRRPDAGNVAK